MKKNNVGIIIILSMLISFICGGIGAFVLVNYNDSNRVITTNYMECFLPILSNYRNLCAHEDIVYDHRTEKGIVNTPYHAKLHIPVMDDEYIYGKNDIFSVFIIFKYLLRDDDFRLMMREINYEIEKLDGVINSIPINKILDRMGIPDNYMDLVDL